MSKFTYKKSGVDINKADRLIKNSINLISGTRVKGSMDKIGGFSAAFDIRNLGYKDPVLVASTDGVGTKLKIAIDENKHDTVGIDLVAMSVNDCLCSGARPLFFLDYFASGALEEYKWNAVIRGIVKGCKDSGCALIGGETAEMPGMYKKGDYDLAGFAVGIVERKKIIDGRKIKIGDIVLGVASTGLHSNGFSLVRKIFTKKEIHKLSDIILKPTRIYVRPILDIMGNVEIKGIAHITGGGFYENMPRILPKGKAIVIKNSSWDMPRIFRIILNKSNIKRKELFRTFNMGIGMILILSPGSVRKVKDTLRNKYKIQSWEIGKVTKGNQTVSII